MAKNCLRCGAENPTGESRRWGERKYCSKKCSHASWVSANPESRAKHLKNYDSSEHGRARRKKWESDNQEILSAKAKDRYLENRPERIAKAIIYQRLNPEVHRRANAAYQGTEHGRQKALEVRWRRIARVKSVDDGFKISEFTSLCNDTGWRCFSCLKHDDGLEIDHVMPIAKGGRHHIGNIQPLCRACNASKGATHRDYRPEFALQPNDLIQGIAA